MASLRDSVEALIPIIHRYFIWATIGAYVLAAIAPQLGLWMRNIELGSVTLLQQNVVLSVPLFLLASLLFNAGLGVKVRELRQLLHQPLVLLSGLVGNLATPLVCILGFSVALQLWNNSEEVQQILVGLALVAAMPIAGASPAWAQNANGNLALSLGLVLLTTALSPIFTPMVLHVVGLVTIDDYSEDLHELASDGVVAFLGIWVILPSVLGILTQWALGERHLATAKPYLKLFNYGVLVSLTYSNAALALPKAFSHPDIAFLVIVAVISLTLCLAAFGAGYLLSRVFRTDRSDRVSLMFGLGMNNNGAGLVLASMALGDHPEVMLPIIFYNLVQHLMAAAVDWVMFQQAQQIKAIRVVP
ncbi:MAG: bile acid:sodium symporter [Nitrospirales bacterium]